MRKRVGAILYALACLGLLIWVWAGLFLGPGVFLASLRLSVGEPTWTARGTAAAVSAIPWVLLVAAGAGCRLQGSTWRRLVIGVGVLVAVACVGHRFLGGNWVSQNLGLGNPYNDLRFVQAVWLAHPSTMDIHSPRGHMVADLLAHHLRLGMTRVEVESLLGPPPPTREPRGTRERKVLCYPLGIYSRWLDLDLRDLRFDRDGCLWRAAVID